MPEYAAVELPLLFGQVGQAAHDDELVAAREPRQAPRQPDLDRPLEHRTAGHVGDPEGLVLGPGVGPQVRDAIAFQGDGNAVERHGEVVGPGVRVQQHAFGAVGLANDETPKLLVGHAAKEEAPVPAPRGCGDHAGHQFAQTTTEALPAGRRVEGATRQPILGLGPRHRPRVFEILEPAVRVGDGLTVEHVDHVDPLSRGITHRRQVTARAGLGPRLGRRWGWGPVGANA